MTLTLYVAEFPAPAPIVCCTSGVHYTHAWHAALRQGGHATGFCTSKESAERIASKQQLIHFDALLATYVVKVSQGFLRRSTPDDREILALNQRGSWVLVFVPGPFDEQTHHAMKVLRALEHWKFLTGHEHYAVETSHAASVSRYALDPRQAEELRAAWSPLVSVHHE